MAACGCGFKRDGSGERTVACKKHKDRRSLPSNQLVERRLKAKAKKAKR